MVGGGGRFKKVGEEWSLILELRDTSLNVGIEEEESWVSVSE